MAFLADLFNPTFIMFLGILVLVVAILIIYFEGKMREQNHKITTMFSLVSTLAEDMNGIKLGFNQLAINSVGGGGQFFRQTLEEPVKTFNIEENVNLINVSDDEESDNDEDSNSEAESEINDDSDSEEDLDLDEENNEHEIDVHDNESEDNDSDDEEFDNKSDIKVLKIYNNTNEENELEEINNNTQELDVLDTSYIKQYNYGLICLGILTITYALLRTYLKCDTAASIGLGLVFGCVTGFAIVYQNTHLFGRNSINFMGIPLLRSKTADGQAIYICS
jgi:hypothetical protein